MVRRFFVVWALAVGLLTLGILMVTGNWYSAVLFAAMGAALWTVLWLEEYGRN